MHRGLPKNMRLKLLARWLTFTSPPSYRKDKTSGRGRDVWWEGEGKKCVVTQCCTCIESAVSSPTPSSRMISLVDINFSLQKG